jgi:hypothetical protein
MLQHVQELNCDGSMAACNGCSTHVNICRPYACHHLNFRMLNLLVLRNRDIPNALVTMQAWPQQLWLPT